MRWRNIKKCQMFLKYHNMTLLQCEKKPPCTVLRNTIDIQMIEALVRVIARGRCISCPNSNKAEIDIQSFRWTVPGWKINLISRCFRWMLVSLLKRHTTHLDIRNTVASGGWNVEPQETQGCCCVYFSDVRWNDSWGFFQSHQCKEVGIATDKLFLFYLILCIQKPMSQSLIAIRLTLKVDRGSVHASKIGWEHGKIQQKISFKSGSIL